MQIQRYVPSPRVLVPVVGLVAAAFWYGSQGRWLVVGSCVGAAIGVLIRKRARRALELGTD